jgi:hypothetical protein
VFTQPLSGAASFAACLRLFRSYPLAVNRSSPHAGDGWQRSIVLRYHAVEGVGYYRLTQDPGGHFTLRPWEAGTAAMSTAAGQEIRPGSPVPVASHRVITEGMPVPRDSALLGWVSDRQAIVLLSVYHGRPGRRPGVPQVRVLALAGSEPLRWPPFTASPLDDGRLWQYVESGEIVDLAPVIVRGASKAFWVPSQNTARAAHGHGCAVVSQNLTTEEYWVPPGVYMDHWMLREGVPTPPASHLVTLPGTTALARRLPVW